MYSLSTAVRVNLIEISYKNVSVVYARTQMVGERGIEPRPTRSQRVIIPLEHTPKNGGLDGVRTRVIQVSLRGSLNSG